VRGCRYEEAIQRLERQIDNAVIKGMREFTIIHGMGTGVLQEGIHRYLAQSNVIEDYFFSHPDDGGFGKTIVRLKS
jgi:DNA mismatch repair protein MutS2